MPPVTNNLNGDVGLDVKYGITQNLVADLTVNTDFAQVEADEQQVNLTRFSLFFPEKREFFLENQGTFAFGGAGTGTSAGGGNFLRGLPPVPRSQWDCDRRCSILSLSASTPYSWRKP